MSPSSVSQGGARGGGGAKGAQAPPWFWSDPRQINQIRGFYPLAVGGGGVGGVGGW